MTNEQKRRTPVVAVVIAAMMTTTFLTGCQGMPGLGSTDPNDVCRDERAALQKTGDYFTESVVTGAVIGAVAGVGLALLTGGRGASLAAPLIAGAFVGAAGGYLKALHEKNQGDKAAMQKAAHTDISAANQELDKTQIAFDQLVSCRQREALSIRDALALGKLQRPEAEQQMAAVRARYQQDVAIARDISKKIDERSSGFSNAAENLSTPGRLQQETQASTFDAVFLRPNAVRASPRNDALAMGDVKAGDTKRVIGQIEGWARVQMPNGKTGFVRTTELGRLTPQQPHIAKAKTTLLAEARDGAAPLRTLSSGSRQPVVAQMGEWSVVDLGAGKYGFAKASTLTASRAPTGQRKPAPGQPAIGGPAAPQVAPGDAEGQMIVAAATNTVKRDSFVNSVELADASAGAFVLEPQSGWLLMPIRDNAA